MTDRDSIYRRLTRRETHSSRSGAAVTVAALLAIVLLVAVVLGVWAMADAGVRAVSADRFSNAVDGMGPATLIVGGAVCMVLAVVLLIFALAPGRRARRARTTQRIALVVDDGVLADAAADAVARQCAIGRNQVSTRITRRGVIVRVTPTSGVSIDRGHVAAAAIAAVAGAGFETRALVHVAPQGVVA